MKTRLFILIAITALPLFSYAFGENQTIEIGIGQTVQLDDFELIFYDIEDSRCPLDVTCVWEGRVTAMIKLDNKTMGISAPFTPGRTIAFPPYEITLTDIQPHPISTEEPDYVATLELSRIQVFTGEQICGKGNVLVEGICIPAESSDFRDAEGEIIEVGNSIGDMRCDSSDFVLGHLFPELCPRDQFVVLVLVIVLPIAGIVSGFIVWRKRK